MTTASEHTAQPSRIDQAKGMAAGTLITAAFTGYVFAAIGLGLAGVVIAEALLGGGKLILAATVHTLLIGGGVTGVFGRIISDILFDEDNSLTALSPHQEKISIGAGIALACALIIPSAINDTREAQREQKQYEAAPRTSTLAEPAVALPAAGRLALAFGGQKKDEVTILVSRKEAYPRLS